MPSPKTVGVEIELEYVSPTVSGQLQSVFKHAIYNDGSLRHRTYNVSGVPFYFPPGEKPPSYFEIDRPGEFGTELVSEIYSPDNMRVALRETAPYLAHVPHSPASSIHYHVDVGDNPWTVIQNVFTWAYHLEAVLFRLSCAGETHRGESQYRGKGDPVPCFNDYRFARPLSAPIGIHTVMQRGAVMQREQPGGGIAMELQQKQVNITPLVDVQRLLAANTASEMVSAWGRMDLYWNIPGRDRLEHYVPHRLHMVNPCAILRHGCLEWRLTDGRYEHMARMFDVIMAVHELAVAGKQPDFAPMILGREYGVDARWVSDLLGVDVAPMWGHRWPGPTEVANRPSHYARMDVPSLEVRGVEQINNTREVDNGTRNYVLYRRKR